MEQAFDTMKNELENDKMYLQYPLLLWRILLHFVPFHVRVFWYSPDAEIAFPASEYGSFKIFYNVLLILPCAAGKNYKYLLVVVVSLRTSFS